VATCNLTIELDDERKAYVGGETVSGTVVVRCDNDTQCQGLEVSTNWATHGRGNIDQGVGEQTTVFSGSWMVGQEYRYPFQLRSAEWPPTYFGSYLNVSHTVRARAKIAWAVDPKAEKEFTVVATNAPDDAQPKRQPAGAVGGVIGWIILAAVLALFAVFLFWVVPIILVIAGLVWFFKSYLPKQLTGEVLADVQPNRVRPNEPLNCHLEFTPQRNLSINGITCTLRCVERCSSGSGSNRRTHTHELFLQVATLAAAQILPAQQKQTFAPDLRLPKTAPPSMKLSDNELLWTIDMRIDIPRWPDWTKSFQLTVAPSKESLEELSSAALGDPSDDDAWLHEVLNQLEQSGDRERLEVILQAIGEDQFNMTIETQGLMEDPPQLSTGERGQWLSGYYEPHDLLVALFLPASAPPPVAGPKWRGSFKILDFDHARELLVLKAL
jgi:hypothetical protein